MKQNSVYLLYEGNEWLNTDSLVLMGVFTSERMLRCNALELIKQRGKKHLRDVNDGMGCDFEDVDSVCEDILLELMSRGATSGYSTNYCYTMANLNELGEI